MIYGIMNLIVKLISKDMIIIKDNDDSNHNEKII